MGVLEETLAAIAPTDEAAAAEASRRLDSLTKPRGSLGYLEEIVRRYAAIRRDPAARMGGGALCVFVADHGVAEEGVSAYPQAVTAEMLRNIAGGGAAISVLARRLRLSVVDRRRWRGDRHQRRCAGRSPLSAYRCGHAQSGARGRDVRRTGARRAGGWRGSRARRDRGRRHADRNRRDGNRQQHLGSGIACGVHADSSSAPGRTRRRRGRRRDAAQGRSYRSRAQAPSCSAQRSARHARGVGRLRDRRDGRRVPGRRGAERAGGG